MSLGEFRSLKHARGFSEAHSPCYVTLRNFLQISSSAVSFLLDLPNSITASRFRGEIAMKNSSSMGEVANPSAPRSAVRVIFFRLSNTQLFDYIREYVVHFWHLNQSAKL